MIDPTPNPTPDCGADTDREGRVGQLYRRYAPHIAAYALRRAAPDEAADVVSETFLVAWRRAGDVPPEPHTLPWLYGVARRVLANQRRSTRRRGRLRQRLTAQFTEQVTPPTTLEHTERLEGVTRAMSQLSDDDAELLRLVAWEGMTPMQIAAILDLEANAVRQRIHRARRRLRAAMELLEPPTEPTSTDRSRARIAAARTGRSVHRS